jgi:hypothetical protein
VAIGDKEGIPQLLNWRTMVCCDMIKSITDCFLAPHFGTMINGHAGLFTLRYVGMLGVTGSVAQFIVRFRQQVDYGLMLD